MARINRSVDKLHFRSISLKDFMSQKLIDEGFEETEPGLFTKIEGNARLAWRRDNDNNRWESWVDILTTVEVLTPEDLS